MTQTPARPVAIHLIASASVHPRYMLSFLRKTTSVVASFGFG
jgi:hypothetical protein